MSKQEPLEFARMKVTLRKEPERMFFDFTGTADQVKVSINCPANQEYYVKYLSCILRLLAPDIVMNDGQTQVLEALIPAGTILNPRFPRFLLQPPLDHLPLDGSVHGRPWSKPWREVEPAPRTPDPLWLWWPRTARVSSF